MMSAILNSAILVSTILNKKKLHSFILTQLYDGSHLEYCHLGSAIGFNHFEQKKTSLIHSHSTLWWQPSWILPSWIQQFCTKLWLKLTKKNFIFTQLDNARHLDTAILDSTSSNKKKLHSFILTQLDNGSHLWILPSWIQLFCTKTLHSFILTQLDDCSHLEFCHVGLQPLSSWIQTPCYLLWDSLKNTLTPLWLWLKLIQSDSTHSFSPNLMMVSHLEFCHFEFCHLGFSHLILPRLVPTICTKKTSLHSFILIQTLPTCYDSLSSLNLILNLMMVAILNFAILYSAVILNSAIYSAISKKKKYTHSFWLNLMMSATSMNSAILVSTILNTKKTSLIHSDSTWWWQPSWILPCWNAALCHLGFRHLVIFFQIHSKTLSLHSDSDSN